jgi:hypothetical protein
LSLKPPAIDRPTLPAGDAAAPTSQVERRAGMPGLRGLHAFVLLAYTVLAVGLFSNVWVHPAAAWIGDAKDPKLFIWYLGWLPNQLLQLRDPLLTNYLAYPDGVNLMWNTSIVFPALILWPVTQAFGPVVAYNVLVTGALALSAWLAYLAATRYLSHPLLAAGVGLLYGFSPGMLAQATRHPHVAMGVFPPLIWLLGDEIAIRQRWRPLTLGVVTGAVVAAQLLIGEEVLAVTVLVAAVGVALLAAQNRGEVVRRRLAYAGRAVAAGLVAFFVLAGYPLAVQFLGPHRISQSLQPADRYVTDALSFIVADPALVRFGGSAATVSHFTGNLSENDGYVGLPVLVLFFIGLAAGWRRPVVRWAGLLAMAVAGLSLGPRLHVDGTILALPLPWALVARLPLMGSALPSRLMLISWLGVGLVVMALIERAAHATKRDRLVAALALLIAAASLVPAWPVPSTPAGAPRFFQPGGAVEAIPRGSVVLVTPFASGRTTDAMYWQALSNYRFRMPEGDVFATGPYLGPRPTYLQTVLDQLDEGQDVQLSPENRARAIQDLSAMGATAVVAGPSPGHDRIVRFLTSLLVESPAEVGGVSVWWRVGQPAAGLGPPAGHRG